MEPKNSDPAAVYFIKCLIKRYIDDDVGSFASEASYCFILGLIPFMIFLVNCILFFAAPQLDTILDLLQYLPAQFAASMEEISPVSSRDGVRYGSLPVSAAQCGPLHRGRPSLSAGWIKYFSRTEISSRGSRSA